MQSLNDELVQLLDVLLDQPDREPDLNIVSHVIAGSQQPIALTQQLVLLLWLAAERPHEFDQRVLDLYE